MSRFNISYIILFLILCGCSEQNQEIDKTSAGLFQCDEDNGGLSLPDGFCAGVVADNLGFVRHLVASPRGDLYITLRNQRLALGGLLQLRDLDGDGRMEDVQKIHDVPGMGIALNQDYLYFASDEEIYRYAINNETLSLQPEIVATGFPKQSLHAAKTLALGQNDELFVNLGSKTNACQLRDLEVGSPGLSPCDELQLHGGVWMFDASQTQQDFSADGIRYASGIRNAYAIDWHPVEKKLYVVQHGRDQLAHLWSEHFTPEQEIMLPAEEMFSVEKDAEYSWPYCYYDPVLQQRMLAPEYGGDGQTQDKCAEYSEPLIAFPGHYGPNDLLIYTGKQFPQKYYNGGFVAFHGRHNDEYGYQLVFVPSGEQGLQPEWQVFAKNKQIQQAETLTEYRPTGIAQGADGSLFLSDSVQGRVWRIIYRGEK